MVEKPWIQEYQEYQTLVVGALGFLGVIITLFVNAWQARKQLRDDHQQARGQLLEEQRLKREELKEAHHHECQTLRASLVEELKIDQKILRDSIEVVKKAAPTQHITLSVDLPDDAYRSFINRIGLLSQGEVSKVMRAYLNIRNYRSLARIFFHKSEQNWTYIAFVPEESDGQILLGMMKNCNALVDEAIVVLESGKAPQF